MRSIDVDIKNDSILNPEFDKRNEVINWSLNGKDNQLPSIIEYLSNESVTVKSCLSKCIPAIIGGGFLNGNFIVNDENQTLNAVGRKAAKELEKQSNVFIHVRYNVNGDVSKVKVVDTKKVRLGSSDDADYIGKYLIANWSAKRISNGDIKVIDAFNPDVRAVKAQIDRDGGINKYMGQILHLTKDGTVKYAPANIYPVLEDAEFERQSKIFRKNNAEFGFLNSKVVLVGKMGEDDERKFKADFKNMQGAYKSNNVLVYQAQNSTQELDKQMIVKDLSSNPNDKVLSYSDTTAEANICKSFGVPVALISSRSEGIFGNSGELLKEMKRQLYEDKEFERSIIEEGINSILSRSSFKIKKTSIIDPFSIVEEEQENDPETKNKEAQANLRGSVGGVTSLLSIQNSVSEGKTSIDSAISMVVNIFGFSEAVAREIIGNPKTTQE